MHKEHSKISADPNCLIGFVIRFSPMIIEIRMSAESYVDLHIPVSTKPLAWVAPTPLICFVHVSFSDSV